MELPEEEEKAGIPAWVVTFADLMSLLMCFFVLLLSFSEIDAMKFKQIAGELSKAFGVQREVPALEIPMGTSPIFDKFSPGIPDPTPIDEVRQQTTEELPQLDTVRADMEAELQEKVASTTERQLEINLNAIQDVLSPELMQGRLQVEREHERVIIRIEERGSFQSGSAEMTEEFEDILLKISEVLSSLPGEIAVEGHTDDIPINTARFRSNWDLSAARASSVANALLATGAVDAQRLKVQGFAETRPRASNDQPETRALNRRVEIVVDLAQAAEDYEGRLRQMMEADVRMLIDDVEVLESP
ncbi:MotB family protein [Halopseudomonas sp.]|jgi:chemotaxis protein MotB|uniref:MotB family protein n=1 Tax=Halopseudomonas sp. TaxID=2901191 RepID=UPI0039E5BECE